MNERSRGTINHIQASALEALQEATEAMLINELSSKYQLHHRPYLTYINIFQWRSCKQFMESASRFSQETCKSSGACVCTCLGTPGPAIRKKTMGSLGKFYGDLYGDPDKLTASTNIFTVRSEFELVEDGCCLCFVFCFLQLARSAPGCFLCSKQ
jgi:hypothetical protein